jgi:hypothetical protein
VTSRARKNQATQLSPSASERIDSAILWITLGVLFIVPLVFSYFGFTAIFSEFKLLALHLGAALIAGLWLWQITLRKLDSYGSQIENTRWDPISWAGRNPARWALIFASAWVISQTITMLLSPLPTASLFGFDTARSGYNLYDNISMFVIFLAVALRFRTPRSLTLLAYALISSGTIVAIYGTAQHFGWDPLNERADHVQVWASFGNPLNFAGYLVMTIPATLAITMLKQERHMQWSVGLIVALSFQIVGIWLAAERGPYISLILGTLVFFLLAGYLGSLKSLVRPGVTFIVGAVIAAIIIALPSPNGDAGLDRFLSIFGQFTRSDDTSTDIQGGLDGRFSIWNSTLELATSWDTPQEDAAISAALRPVFGLGQNMYVNSFPFVGNPQSNDRMVEHAHNYPLQILMEQGFLGLLLLVSLTVLLLATMLNVVKRIKSSASGIDVPTILALAIIPSALGKMIEMQTGVPRVSDLVMTFALLGAVIAVSKIVNSEESATASTVTETGSSSSIPLPPSITFGTALISAILLTVVGLMMFVGWDLRRLSASRTWSVAISATNDLDKAQGWTDAQAQSPERPFFTNALVRELFVAGIDERRLGNEDDSFNLMLVARNLLFESEMIDPYKRETKMNLFGSAATLAQWGYDGFKEDAEQRASEILEQYATFPSLLEQVAVDLANAGSYTRAIEVANQVILTEATTKPWAKASYAQGKALYDLGVPEEAIKRLNDATEKDPGSDGAVLAHKALAIIYSQEGNLELSEFHNGKADEPTITDE